MSLLLLLLLIDQVLEVGRRGTLLSLEQGMRTDGDASSRTVGRQGLSFVDDVCILVVRARH